MHKIGADDRVSLGTTSQVWGFLNFGFAKGGELFFLEALFFFSDFEGLDGGIKTGDAPKAPKSREGSF